MLSRRMGLALLLGGLLCAAPALWADSTARIVRLSYLDGDVQIDRATGKGLERAVLNMPVVQGTQLVTRDGGAAEVEFEDGSTLRLVPESKVQFSKLSLRDDGTRVSSIELVQGTAYLEATTKKDQFSLLAGGQEITLAHDAHLRVRRGSSDMALAVFKGEVDVQNPSGSVRVKKDETLNMSLNDPSQYELAKGIDPEGYDTWNQQRDQYRQTYAANHRHVTTYSSLYDYGWSDLNYFGAFTQYPGYGSLWRPAGVGMGWDPFADGAWMYYPGYGYMWVSGYPWGWMPYRYGSWTFVPGFGWGWNPGMMWNTWYGMPLMYGAPVGYVSPRPPVIKGGSTLSPATVVVGAGPMTGVRSARYSQWMQQRAASNLAMRKSAVTPVPPPPSMTAAARKPSMESRTNTSSTSSARSSTRSDSQERGRMKQGTPPARPASPPPPPARVEAPPPPPIEAPGRAEGNGGWGGGSSAGSAPRTSPHK